MGCMPTIHPPEMPRQSAEFHETYWLTADGAVLPMLRWLPKASPRAVIIALHGFNDYSRFFSAAGDYLSHHGIAGFAYDQRGFGATTRRGLWAGAQAYRDDLQAFVHLIKQHYPSQPLYLLGESMGGAVIIDTVSQIPDLPVAGVILSAPAVWARSTMPWYQTGLLWMLAHTTPWLTLTGKGVVKVKASDNIPMLRALGNDPWIIKATRVEALHGLANLMDSAYRSAPSLPGDTLLLYGEKDEIIPKKPTSHFIRQLLTDNGAGKTVAIYPDGYHMLLRDLQAEIVWKDIAAWVTGGKSLPSHADKHSLEKLMARLR